MSNDSFHATLKRVLGFCGVGVSYINQHINKVSKQGFYFGLNAKKQLTLTHGQGTRTGYPNKPSTAVNSWVVSSLFSPTDAKAWEGRSFTFQAALDVLQSNPISAADGLKGAAVQSLPAAAPVTTSAMLLALQSGFDVNKPTTIDVGGTYRLKVQISASSGNHTTTLPQGEIVRVIHKDLNNSIVVPVNRYSSYAGTVSNSGLEDVNEATIASIQKQVQTLAGLTNEQRNELAISIRKFVEHFTK